MTHLQEISMFVGISGGIAGLIAVIIILIDKRR